MPPSASVIVPSSESTWPSITVSPDTEPLTVAEPPVSVTDSPTMLPSIWCASVAVRVTLTASTIVPSVPTVIMSPLMTTAPFMPAPAEAAETDPSTRTSPPVTVTSDAEIAPPRVTSLFAVIITAALPST